MERIIVIGASAGGVQALQELAQLLPADLGAPVLIVQHIGAFRSVLPEILERRSILHAEHAEDGATLEAGRIYVAPPDRHLIVIGKTIRLTHGPKEHHTRPAIDPLFRSAALAYGPDTIGVVLTGMLDDGTSGLQAIKRCGGIAVVQDPRDALEPSMPQSALRYVDVDHCVPIAAMGDLLADLAAAPRPVGAQVEDERTSHEQDLTLCSGDAMEHLSAIGAPSPYVCPECHGGLWEVKDVRPRRFRCHTGHAFTLRSLQHALASTSDEALWSAFRALEERAFVVQELIKSSNELDDQDQLASLQSIAEELNRRALELRALLERVPDPIE